MHDNFIINQVGDAILIGQYVTGENWVYNNVIANAGLGPDPDPRESDPVSHFGVNIDAGHETIDGTVVHFYNNTIYGCGWRDARSGGATGAVHIVHSNRYRLNLSNNIVYSTGEPYVSGWSDKSIDAGKGRNLWFGKGAPPAWDASALNVDPRFVAAAACDFHLQAGSPAIRVGIYVGSSRISMACCVRPAQRAIWARLRPGSDDSAVAVAAFRQAI